MKIGIVTFHHAPSYGAFFQAYALATYLKGLGHSVEVIDYLPEHRREALWQFDKLKWSWRRFGFNGENVFYLNGKNFLIKNIKSYLPLTKKTYYSLQELEERPPKIDVCILGSDQIWNYELTGGFYDPAYFGVFGTKDIYRIAYAASFGRGEVPKFNEQLKNYLTMIDTIFVREKSAIHIVEEHSNKKAIRVLDPTFLLNVDQYPIRKKKLIKGDYILAYPLQNNELFQKTLEKVKSECGLPIVYVKSSLRFMKYSIQPTPLQLLNIIKNARYVVTSSFHGLALSLNFQIDFIAVSLVGEQKNKSIRMTDILEDLNLLSRFVFDIGSLSRIEVNCRNVDWNKCSGKLVGMRQESKRLLKKTLQNI